MNTLEKALMQSNVAAAYLSTGEIAGICNEHDLNFTQVMEAYQQGSTVVTVALLGEANGWPAEHVKLARSVFKIPPPSSVVICVRDPDYENTFERFGAPVSIFDIDLGIAAPEEYDADWIESHMQDVERLMRWNFEPAAVRLAELVISNTECTGHWRVINNGPKRVVVIEHDGNTCSLHEATDDN